MKESNLLELAKLDTKVINHNQALISLEAELETFRKAEREYEPAVPEGLIQLINQWESAITIIKNYDKYLNRYGNTSRT